MLLTEKSSRRMLLVLLSITVLCAATIWLQLHHTNKEIIATRFTEVVENNTNQLIRRFSLYEYGLRGMRGNVLGAGPDQYTRAHFEVYYASRDLIREFPGARGIGFVRKVARSDVPSFITRNKRIGQPGFALKELAQHDLPERFIIQFISPLITNRPALGLDIASEVNRREAFINSAKMNQAILSRPVSILQAVHAENRAFLLSLPIYRPGLHNKNPEELWRATVGWAYMPLLIDDILKDLDFDHGNFELTLSMPEKSGIPNVFFDSRRAEFTITPPLVRKRLTRHIFGTEWTLDFRATPQFVDRLNLTSPHRMALYVLVVGCALSALAYFLMLQASRRRESWMVRERSARIVDSTWDAIVTKDLQGVITSWNPAAERIFGFKAEEAIGRSVFDLIIPYSHVDEEHKLLAAIAQDQPIPAFDTLRKHCDGHLIDVGLSIAPLHNEEGKVIGGASAMRDISERRFWTQQLENSVENMQMAVELANIGVWSWKIGTPAMVWDERMQQFYGQSEAAVGLVPIDEAFALIHPDDRERIRAGFDALILERMPFFVTFRGLEREGETHYFQTTGVLELDAEDKPVRVHGITREITAERLHAEFLEEQRDRLEILVHERTVDLSRAMEEAARSSQAKSEFLTSMSHELRTPMNAIIGFSQLLETDPTLNLDQRENIDEILKAARHLLSLINEVLDLSKIESGHVDLSLEPVKMSLLVEECLRLVKPMTITHNIQISVQIDQSAIIMADRVRLRQILLNLLSNAIKYNREQGDVVVEVSVSTEGQVLLKVRDTGKGIPATMQSHIFEPFNRAGAEASQIEGTGVGLSITKQLVELMQGSISFISQEGKGTEFLIHLPHAKLPSTASAESNDTTVGLSTDGALKTILCVDDNQVNLRLITQIMKTLSGVSILTAPTATLGLELAGSHHPNLILLDINMPGMNGYEVLQSIREISQLDHTPVVAVTANAMQQDIERGLEAGFAAYITKPLDVEDFLKTVKQLLS